MRPLRCATRRSSLALAQCRSLLARLRVDDAVDVRELLVVTSGDRVVDRPLAEVGGKGLFVKEIEEALLDRRADFAIHSMKDVPGTLAAGLTLASVPLREDPRDVLIAPRHCTLQALPSGARVGTSSPRRVTALRALRSDLEILPLRGNVDTRLSKVDRGDCDAIVLARAGLLRLGLDSRATEVLEPEASLPAVGQGALAIECRVEDEAVIPLVARLHHPETAIRVSAERGVLGAVGGDCHTPLAAFADRVDCVLRLRAWVSMGEVIRRCEIEIQWPDTVEEARAVGEEVGRRLLERG
jgi:hydroxymethylbilane synthase